MASGPSRSVQHESAQTLNLRPPVTEGADYFTSPADLEPGFLRQSENVRFRDRRLSRRLGPQKVYRASSPCGSKTFGTTGKYATIPAAAQLLVGYGGFALHFSVVASRGAATAQLLHGQDGADSVPPLDISLSTSGVLTALVNWDAGGSSSVVSAALADGSTQHGLFVYDAPSGTLNLDLNGVAVGTPVTGLGSAKRPVQTANMAWLVAAKKTAAAVVSQPWIGAIDSLTLFSLAGARPASGTTTLLSTLLAHSQRQWPTPQMDCVLFNYDMDAAGAVMKDSSLFANNATVTGTPSDTGEVALSSIPMNFVGALDAADGSRSNLIGSAGRLYYQTVRPA